MAKKKKAVGLEIYRDKEADVEGIGAGWLGSLGEAMKTAWVKYLTWQIDLDIGLRGGFPSGQNSVLVGPTHAGKTHMTCAGAASMYNTCRKCRTPIIDWHNHTTGEVKTQCRCKKKERMRIIHVMAERRYDPSYMNKYFGLPLNDPQHYLLGHPKSGDDLTDAVERSAQGKRRLVDAFVIDSLAALFPEEMDGRRSSNAKIGAHSKMIQNLIFTVLRENSKLGSDTSSDITLLATNQMRANLSFYGKSEKEAGGHAYMHMMTTNIYMKKPAINDKIDKKGLADPETQRYADFVFKLNKATMGGGVNFTGGYRGYMQTYKGHGVGDSDEPERLYAWLEALGLAGKKKSKYDLMGLTFEKKGDVLNALSHKDMQLMARYPIFYATFPEAAKPYLDPDNFFYNPFYDVEIETGEQNGVEFAKVSLTERGAKKSKPSPESEPDELEGEDEIGDNEEDDILEDGDLLEA